MEIEDSIKSVRDKAPVTPERLAEILLDIHKKDGFILSGNISGSLIYFATELLKVVEVRERE